MREMMSIKVEGLSELVKRMRELEPKLARSALRSAVNAGAQVIKKAAQSLAPVDTGRLSRKALFVQRSKGESGKSKETYRVGVRIGRKEAQKDRDAYYWWFVEFGTKFNPARPFLRPAYDQKKSDAVEAVKLKLFQKLEQLTAGNK